MEVSSVNNVNSYKPAYKGAASVAVPEQQTQKEDSGKLLGALAGLAAIGIAAFALSRGKGKAVEDAVKTVETVANKPSVEEVVEKAVTELNANPKQYSKIRKTYIRNHPKVEKKQIQLKLRNAQDIINHKIKQANEGLHISNNAITSHTNKLNKAHAQIANARTEEQVTALVAKAKKYVDNSQIELEKAQKHAKELATEDSAKILKEAQAKADSLKKSYEEVSKTADAKLTQIQNKAKRVAEFKQNQTPEALEKEVKQQEKAVERREERKAVQPKQQRPTTVDVQTQRLQKSYKKLSNEKLTEYLNSPEKTVRELAAAELKTRGV